MRAVRSLPAAAARCFRTTAGARPAASQRLLWAAAGFGGACAAGVSLAATAASMVAICEEAKIPGVPPGTLFQWGRRFTGNDLIGYCDKSPAEVGLKVIAHMAFGESVGAACDRSGDVYWWGKTSAAGGLPAHVDKAHLLLAGKRIVKVACGAKTSYALSKNGKVWQWPNENPLAGLQEVSVPGGLLGGTAVDVAACSSGEHFLCVTSDGRAFAMGTGARGQLGNGDCENKTKLTPVKLPKGTSALKCAAGAYHSVLLTKEGTVLAFGGDDTMQLGQGRETINQWRKDKEPLTSEIFRTEPLKIIIPAALAYDRAKCVAVAAGHDFSAAIYEVEDKPNCLVSWGNGWRKQLGHKTDVHMSAPRVVATLQGKKEWSEKQQQVVEMGVKSVACGHEHMLALLDNGALMSWGGNREGEVGNDSRKDSKTPQLIMPLQRYRVNAIFAGSRNSAAIIEGPAEHSLELKVQILKE